MNNMPQITIMYALLLILAGVGGYFYFDRASTTILIPAFFGIVVLVAGLLARKEKLLKHAMHAAAGLGILGVFASFRGIKQLPALVQGEEVLRPNAVIMQSLMFSLSFVFVALCVYSFVLVRRQKRV